MKKIKNIIQGVCSVGAFIAVYTAAGVYSLVTGKQINLD